MNDIFANLYREYKTRVTSSRIITENIVNPLVILFIFGVALGEAVGDIKIGQVRVPYLSFFLSGAINISIITNAMVASTRLFLDKYVGLFDEILTYPIKRESILIGKLLFNSILSLVQGIIMLTFTYLMKPGYFSKPEQIILFFLALIIISWGWFFILMFLALKVKTQDEFNSMYYLVMTPLMFISSVYYPLEKTPFIIKAISSINPLTWATDISRFFLLGLPDRHLTSKIILYLFFVIISYILARRSLNVKARRASSAKSP
jgi:ABC-2 type transport system permease protein